MNRMATCACSRRWRRAAMPGCTRRGRREPIPATDQRDQPSDRLTSLRCATAPPDLQNRTPAMSVTWQYRADERPAADISVGGSGVFSKTVRGPPPCRTLQSCPTPGPPGPLFFPGGNPLVRRWLSSLLALGVSLAVLGGAAVD